MPALARGERSSLRVMTAFLGAPVAWALHLFVSYAMVAYACATGWGSLHLALGVATLVLALAAAAAGALAWRAWRRTPAERAPESPEAPGSWRDLLMPVGVLLAALFTLAIVLAGIAPIFVPACP